MRAGIYFSGNGDSRAACMSLWSGEWFFNKVWVRSFRGKKKKKSGVGEMRECFSRFAFYFRGRNASGRGRGK